MMAIPCRVNMVPQLRGSVEDENLSWLCRSDLSLRFLIRSTLRIFSEY